MVETDTMWYTIKVQNNREKSVSEKLKSDAERDYGFTPKFMIPTKAEASIKNGKRVIKEKVLYTGYLFVQTDRISTLISMVKRTNGATNVLCDAKGNPIPLKQKEVDRIFSEKDKTKRIIESKFTVGEKVQVIKAPFYEFVGSIEEMDNEKNKVKLQILIFGRPTTVEMTLDDIVKIQ